MRSIPRRLHNAHSRIPFHCAAAQLRAGMTRSVEFGESPGAPGCYRAVRFYPARIPRRAPPAGERTVDEAGGVDDVEAPNAAGRFTGTLLSGLLFQFGGIFACLEGSALMLAVCWLVTLALPEGRGREAAV